MVSVHPDSLNPNKAWEKLRMDQEVVRLKPMDIVTPIQPDKVRFVCLSDTHNKTDRMTFSVPDGDVLLHAGDITNEGLPHDLENFNSFLGNLPHRYKVVIAGNHDMTFDKAMVRNERIYLQSEYNVSNENFEDYLEKKNLSCVNELLTNCIYLEDQGTEVFGIKIYGSPWHPEFNGFGFYVPRGQPSLDKWNNIPDDTDILLTHGPAIGYGDDCYNGNQVGCVDLLSTVQQRVKPKYHISGHIHEAYGVTTNGTTTFINASICTIQGKPINQPVIFDLPLPPGVTKAD